MSVQGVLMPAYILFAACLKLSKVSSGYAQKKASHCGHCFPGARNTFPPNATNTLRALFAIQNIVWVCW